MIRTASIVLAAAFVTSSAAVYGQSLPLEPIHESGASVTGAFEGWFKNADGTYSLLLGYFNRNTKQAVDIPVGPDNRIEPGGPDQGQPTHFLTGRQWGMFAIKVPADFGKNKLTWTIVANGRNMVIPASLHPDYEISPMMEASVGNTPPVLRFEERGPSTQGPAGMSVSRTVKAGSPLTLTAWVEDDAKLTTSSGAPPRNLGAPVTLRWSKYRGPGEVTFASARPEIEKSAGGSPGVPFAGKATTSATFSAPGEYVLHVTLNDYSGEGGQGFQCCWTTGKVKVTVGQ
ncbi:MAG TPA: hypothetical protein VN841_15765 [Bryobacteraceae bacterium]|nr:hypothetical protein [Bryobacteraceae bacterium]